MAALPVVLAMACADGPGAQCEDVGTDECTAAIASAFDGTGVVRTVSTLRVATTDLVTDGCPAGCAVLHSAAMVVELEDEALVGATLLDRVEAEAASAGWTFSDGDDAISFSSDTTNYLVCVGTPHGEVGGVSFDDEESYSSTELADALATGELTVGSVTCVQGKAAEGEARVYVATGSGPTLVEYTAATSSNTPSCQVLWGPESGASLSGDIDVC
jgi:hypothetical protein